MSLNSPSAMALANGSMHRLPPSNIWSDSVRRSPFARDDFPPPRIGEFQEFCTESMWTALLGSRKLRRPQYPRPEAH